MSAFRGAVPVGVAVTCIAAVLSFPCAAAQHVVRADGTGDFPTIQAAVDSSLAGDEIVLENGVFTGNGNRDIRFHGKDLTVRSQSGAAFCTIDVQGSVAENHRAFRLDAGETAASRIEGITITGGFVEGVFPESGGGGILVADGSHPVITHCVFDGNEAGFEGFGAGLLAWNDCDITLTDCTFRNGVSGWYGGGFTLRKYCDALVERCVVEGNYALHAGGGASITRSDAIVNDCVFVDNETTEATGGGVLVKAEAKPVFTRCTFAGNRAWGGAALGLGNFPEVTAIDCLFENNSSLWRGGAINLDQDPSFITLTNCTFVNNHAGVYGGHVFAGPNATVTIIRSIIDRYCGAPTAIYSDWGAVACEIDCSVVLGGQSELAGPGPRTWGSGNVDADPLFCAPDPDSCASVPAAVGDYSLNSLSSAAPSWNACGLVGAYPVGCGPTSTGAELEARSWGLVKAGYRIGAR